MKIHGMNRKRNKEFFNPILSNHSGHIDGYYKDIELCGNELIIMFEEFNRKKERRNNAVNNSKCQK